MTKILAEKGGCYTDCLLSTSASIQTY